MESTRRVQVPEAIPARGRRSGRNGGPGDDSEELIRWRDPMGREPFSPSRAGAGPAVRPGDASET